jgi:hypothetical protein
MMNKDLLKKDLKRLAAVLTVVTNCFIISGVIHHWRPRDDATIHNNEWNNTYRYTGAKHDVLHTSCVRSRLYDAHRQGRLHHCL